ncbi:unnamed protein product [Nippostrongylus brasiliensis]|uniref:28S ribosomal protein S18a, mitochondrial (inferred by orthology to a human protein) n=1 Tax=Nippostrongylus brasiliensis TaxID=27835 RepID=A0A0N4XT31_NIPBR|nr:unnamed protein product [Nippostrongylus brasiliensis]
MSLVAPLLSGVLGKGPLILASRGISSTVSCYKWRLTEKLSYSDVLIVEQFMREDGIVLPRQHTGLCKRQQLRLERCVMQAHWAVLFPDRTIPEFDRAGYKRFYRYWNDDMDMYRVKEKQEVGSWYYVERYPTGNQGVPP